MTTNNPYAAPESLDAIETTGVNPDSEKIFTAQGRIGRMRYFAYSGVIALAAMAAFIIGGLALMLVGALLGFIGAPQDILAGIGFVIAFVAYIAVIVYVFRWVIIRRLHDLGQSGWLSLVMLVPVINFFFGLYVIFAPGSQSANQWGNPPSANPQWVKVVFWIMMALIALSIVGQLLLGVAAAGL